MADLANLVRVFSSTTGTGTVTLGSAVTGFLTPVQALMVDGKVYSYAIEADYVTVGDDSVPTSREVGTGTYTVSGATLSRSVINSTNSNALLNLAGDAQVVITLIASNIRELLTAARLYYVRSDGSDANSGLADTAGGAWLTPQHAYDYIAANVDTGGQDITIIVAAGTYGGVNVSKQITGGGSISLIGDTTTPTNVIISTTTTNCFEVSNAIGSALYIAGFALRTTSGDLIVCGAPGAVVTINGKIDYGSTTSTQVRCVAPGARITCFVDYTLSGGAAAHYYANSGGFIQFAVNTVTITGTPTIGTFAYADRSSIIDTEAQTFTGAVNAATKKFTVNDVALIFTGTGGTAGYFPGGVAGTQTNGGIYD